MSETRIEVEDVFQNADERAGFNRPDMGEIEFYRGGKLVEVPKKVIDEWVFTGLTNADFILNYDWPE